ncbi:MAG: bifunctional riboflavin kinase/FAD synthetase [Deinococcus-Thermus bacterium]|jgi:riboflavin kinase/FMN adenylyltransferase|nr:bifunctional riboflavin kinase/FAD synthetase [Deinococcota bacterium]
MKRIRRLADVTDADRGASAAIGNFDGVHLGHRAVLDAARAASDAPLGVLTFEPHPREVFRPDDPPFRLMDAEARAHELEKLGVEILYELDFETVRHMDPDAFAETVLARGLGLAHATVGADFRYAKGRAGDADSLRADGARLGFGVTVAPLLAPAPGAPRVSSTAIRAALSEGRPRDAAEMLGHWHRIEGVVRHGDRRGRDLGYPTANIELGRLHLPRFGVYAALADVLDGPHAGRYRGAASLGVRPQFGENRPNLETFLFDFSGDLYGARLSVALVAFVRPEQRFDSVEALVARMERDCAEARNMLTSAA